MTDDEVLEWLSTRGGAEDPVAVRTFRVWLHHQEVIVHLFRYPRGRGYSAEAYLADLPKADRQMNAHGWSIGNLEDSENLALSAVHWNVFRPLHDQFRQQDAPG